MQYFQEVFDKDVISKEFMGVVNFTTDKLKELSLKVNICYYCLWTELNVCFMQYSSHYHIIGCNFGF